MSITFRPEAIPQTVSRPSSRLPDLSMAWMHVGRWSLAIAKRVYPIVLTFAIIFTVVVATIALRMAIWLPTFRY